MKKIMERFAAGLLGLFCILAVLTAPNMAMDTYASAGRMVLGLSSSSLTVGEEVTVTITAQNTEGVSTTAQMRITYDSNVLQYVGSNAQNASASGGEVTATGNSIKFQFKALAEGNSRVVAYGTADAGELSAGGVKISVAAAQQMPADDPAEEPEQGDTPDGSQSEGNNGTTVEPLTASPEFEIGGVLYEVSDEFGAELINLGFEQVEVSVNATTVAGLKYPESDWVVLFLVSKEDDTVNGYYLYDEDTGKICEYLGYSIGEKTADNDSELELLQEKNSTLSTRYDELKETNRRMMIGMIIAVVVLILILINVLILRRINRMDEMEDEEEENEGYDELEVIERQGAYLEATASNSESKEKAAQEDSITRQESNEQMRPESTTEDDFAAEVAAIMRGEKDSGMEPQRSKTTIEKKPVSSSEDSADEDSLEIIDLEDL